MDYQVGKEFTMEKFWDWVKVDDVYFDGYVVTEADQCFDFENNLCFELDNIIWRKNRYFFQDHVKYIHIEIVNPFKVVIIQYT